MILAPQAGQAEWRLRGAGGDEPACSKGDEETEKRTRNKKEHALRCQSADEKRAKKGLRLVREQGDILDKGNGKGGEGISAIATKNLGGKGGTAWDRRQGGN